jgi:hypothetical protein
MSASSSTTSPSPEVGERRPRTAVPLRELGARRTDAYSRTLARVLAGDDPSGTAVEVASFNSSI